MPNGDALRNWWPILTVAAAMLISWGSTQNQLAAMAEDIEEQKVEDARSAAAETATKVKVEVLATKQQVILDDVQEIKEEQKQQGRQLDRIEQLLRQRETVD